jgi:hypothetical protein
MGMNMVFDSSESGIQVAMSGSLCPPVDPSRANTNANNSEELALVRALALQPVA